MPFIITHPDLLRGTMTVVLVVAALFTQSRCSQQHLKALSLYALSRNASIPSDLVQTALSEWAQYPSEMNMNDLIDGRDSTNRRWSDACSEMIRHRISVCNQNDSNKTIDFVPSDNVYYFVTNRKPWSYCVRSDRLTIHYKLTKTRKDKVIEVEDGLFPIKCGIYREYLIFFVLTHHKIAFLCPKQITKCNHDYNPTMSLIQSRFSWRCFGHRTVREIGKFEFDAETFVREIEHFGMVREFNALLAWTKRKQTVIAY